MVIENNKRKIKKEKKKKLNLRGNEIIFKLKCLKNV